MNKIKARMNKTASIGSEFIVEVRRKDTGATGKVELPVHDIEDAVDEVLGEDAYYEGVEVVNVESDFDYADVKTYDLDELNDIAFELDHLDEYDLDTVEALVDDGWSVTEAIEKAPDCFHIPAKNDGDLGYYYVEEIYGGASELGKDTIERYFDYESFGRDIRLEGNFIKTYDGYIEIPY
jgi:hypothetical protein